METRRRSRSDTAVRWWASLNGQPTPERPARSVAAGLALAAVLAAAAMPLVWHHLTVPNPAFYGPPTLEIIHGSDTSNWLIAVAVLAALLALRTRAYAPGSGVTWAITWLAFATVNGMFIDYLDWSRRGVSLYVQPYYGPGFYIGLVCLAVLIATAIMAWRAPS
jgi:hypothetical protein